MTPKGKLIIIGGHEDKGEEAGSNLKVRQTKPPRSHFEILGMLISRIPRAHHVIEIIASASSVPREMEQIYIRSFRQEGFTHVGIIRVGSVADSCDPVNISRVKSAHAVFFTGGDQNRLISLFAGTELLKAIKGKYRRDKNFIVGGTSAGAMVMPEVSITGGVIASALYKGDVHLAPGLGLLQGIIVDTHFIKRGRFARLAHAVTLHPDCLGIGLEENTALLISGGEKAECIGSGMVILMDGSRIRSTNIGEADASTPIVVSGLRFDVLAEGSRYNLVKRKSLSGR